MNPVPMIEVTGLEHAYGALPVVRGLSFRLSRGSIGCLLGLSGCGKTTVLRCVAGFEVPVSGTVRIDGRLVAGDGTWLPPERRGIGMVFQDYALFPHLTVRENIAFGLRSWTGADRAKRVAELIELVRLNTRVDRYPHELSGGQQQRVALARALAPRPDLLLLDEPFSNLDVALRERLSREVREIIKASGATAILVTHDQNEAFAVADEVGIMRLGRIEQWDRAYNLYHRPASRFVAEFIGQGAFLPGRVIDGSTIVIELGALEDDEAAAGLDTDTDVLLRPDDVVPDPSSPVRAEIVAKAFRGAEILYTLKLASGRTVLATTPSREDLPLGESIGVRLEVKHVIAFARESAPNARPR